MKKFFTILLASITYFSTQAIADTNKSFHLDEAEMKAYMEAQGFSSNVDKDALNQQIPVLNVFAENAQEVTFQFENPNGFIYDVQLYTMQGEQISGNRFVQSETITLQAALNAGNEYIYNIQGKDGNIYSGLIKF